MYGVIQSFYNNWFLSHGWGLQVWKESSLIEFVSLIFFFSSFSFLIDERESVQKKTFQKWVNSHLVRVSCRIGDLYVDLRDGKMLLKLLEVLSGERLVIQILFQYTNIFSRQIEIN